MHPEFKRTEKVVLTQIVDEDLVIIWVINLDFVKFGHLKVIVNIHFGDELRVQSVVDYLCITHLLPALILILFVYDCKWIWSAAFVHVDQALALEAQFKLVQDV